MKENRESRLTSAQLERGLQEAFRRRRAAEVNEEVSEPDESGRSLLESRVESVSQAFKKFDLRYGAKRSNSARRYWSHPSVLALGEDDPIERITSLARHMVLDAMEAGWTGPPYDPFALAEHLGIRIVPTEDVIDARTHGGAGGKFTIEFNPSRPPARIRYSIAHEVAHTLFPDCAAAIRNRATHEQMLADEWQLEMLCNVAASEILIPLGTLKESRQIPPSVDKVIELRRKFQVSFEAMLLRLVKVTDHPCFAFAARHDETSDRYKLDYKICSAAWGRTQHLDSGFTLPRQSAASDCMAIEHTSKNEEKWLPTGDCWWVEYLGIPPYPGQVRPRVIGIAAPLEKGGGQAARIKYVNGNATEPRGSDQKLIVQVVNDKALIWGAGFSRQLRQKWPHAQAEFKNWVLSTKREFKLGSTHIVRVDDSTTVASVVAQRGYGPADHPRIRYNALAASLQRVGDLARRAGASIHMPRIGSGLAGGSWEVVEEIVEETLCRQGLRVTVYDLPGKSQSLKKQGSLEFKLRELE
jgi:Zn-dependent peptidase ImmA (M78 family)/O-acetyl-ADP-ribose deacetylase (regulator of RNase III)